MNELRHIMHKRSGDTLRNHMDPEQWRLVIGTYWRLVILAFSLFVIAAFFYGFWQYEDISNTFESAAEPAQATRPVFNRADFDATVAGFIARQNRYSEVQTQPLTVPDPFK